MPPKERGIRKIISAKMLQNGGESKINHGNMIESSKTLEVEIANGKDVNDTEITNNNFKSNTNLNNKVVPLKRGKKKANVSAENEVVSTTDGVVPVINNDEIESQDKQSEKSVTTESITQEEKSSEISKDNDKAESNAEVDVLDDKLKKIPSRRGRPKKVKEETPDKELQTKAKAPSKVEQKEAKISNEEDKYSDLKKIDQKSEEPLEKISEELLAEEKNLSKQGSKKANLLKPDKEKIEDIHDVNILLEKEKLSNLQKTDEDLTEKLSDEQLSAKEKIESKRGRKKANPLKPDKKEVKDSNDAVEEDKLSVLKKIDENNEETPEKFSEEQFPAEEKIPAKRGRKKANALNSDEKKIKDDDEKPSDTTPDEKIETGDKIKSKRGRKKAIEPSKSSESSNLKAMKEELSEKSSNAKDQKNERGEGQSIASRLGRRKVNEKESVEAVTKKQSNEDFIEPNQDMITKKNPEKNIKDVKKNTKDVKDKKQEASSSVTKLSPVGLKRKNETAAEEIEKNKEGFNENKVLKVALQRDDAIDKMCEEETKIKEVGKAKNTKAGGKRAKEEDVDSKDCEETSAKKPKGQPKSKGQSKKDKMPDVTLLDFNNNSTSPTGKLWNLKISSWNVNGIRAWLEKDGLAYITHENPDVIALQETKCSDKMVPKEVNMAGYHAYWLAGDKDGYSGVGLLSKKEPVSVSYGIGVEEHDKEGRVITAEYEEFYLVAAYIPNAGRGLVRLDYRMDWDKDFRSYIKNLDEKKPVVLCGDLNVAHEEIDLANPKTNKKNAGFTKEEREGFSALLSEGFIDSYRHLYPDVKGAYTFWTYMMNARAKNVGW